MLLGFNDALTVFDRTLEGEKARINIYGISFMFGMRAQK